MNTDGDISPDTIAAFDRCDRARIAGHVRDYATAWARVHPDKPLPGNPHTILATIADATDVHAWLSRRMIRRNELIARIMRRLFERDQIERRDRRERERVSWVQSQIWTAETDDQMEVAADAFDPSVGPRDADPDERSFAFACIRTAVQDDALWSALRNARAVIELDRAMTEGKPTHVTMFDHDASMHRYAYCSDTCRDEHAAIDRARAAKDGAP